MRKRRKLPPKVRQNSEGVAALSQEVKPSKGYTEKIIPGSIDLPFFIIIIILLVLGIVMMFSASFAIAINETGDGLYYVKRQMLFAGIGLVGMFIAAKFDYHHFKKTWMAYGIFIIALALLVIVLILPSGREDDFKRWINLDIGGTNFGFQPSEIMKFALIIIFSYIISANYSRMNKFKYGVLPFILILGLVAVLVLAEHHLSGTVIICFIGFVMIFVGGAKISHLGGVLAAGLTALVAGLLYLISIGKFDYVTSRIASWLDPFNPESMANSTWQTCQSLITIGSGGLFGLGLGNSRQKYMYLPEAENDFVFSIICEELGFIGAMMVIILFALFIFRGFYLASKSPDKFGMMLAVGITVQIGIQALLNIAVVTNSMPNTGISLPFFSYGGTALIMQLTEMGVLLNISRQSVIET